MEPAIARRRGGMTRRRWGAVAGALAGSAAAGAAGACGAPGGSGEAKPASQAPAKIRLFARTPQEEDALNEQLPVFMKQHPHITVETESVAGGDLLAKLQTMAASDTIPDNAQCYIGN